MSFLHPTSIFGTFFKYKSASWFHCTLQLAKSDQIKSLIVYLVFYVFKRIRRADVEAQEHRVHIPVWCATQLFCSMNESRIVPDDNLTVSHMLPKGHGRWLGMLLSVSDSLVDLRASYTFGMAPSHQALTCVSIVIICSLDSAYVPRQPRFTTLRVT